MGYKERDPISDETRIGMLITNPAFGVAPESVITIKSPVVFPRAIFFNLLGIPGLATHADDVSGLAHVDTKLLPAAAIYRLLLDTIT